MKRNSKILSFKAIDSSTEITGAALDVDNTSTMNTLNGGDSTSSSNYIQASPDTNDNEFMGPSGDTNHSPNHPPPPKEKNIYKRYWKISISIIPVYLVSTLNNVYERFRLIIMASASLYFAMFSE